jgi:hypothetical protein
MGVREDDGVEVFGAAVEAFVLLALESTGPLKEAAIEKDPPVGGFDQVLAAGDFAGGPEERDFHADFLTVTFS